MNRREIKQRYNDSFDALTPDIFDRIMEVNNADSCKEFSVDNVCSFSSHRHWHKRIACMSGVAAACVLAIIGINMYRNQIVSEVVIDTNASIQIDVKRNGNISSVKAIDKEAVKIAESIETGKLEKTVDDIISKCIKDGYLEDSDVVMVSMECGGDSGLLEETSEIINNLRDDNKDDYSVICQVYEENDEILELAQENAISPGHAALCTTVAQKAEEMGITDVKMDALCTESIGDIIKEAVKYDIGIEEDDSIIWDGDEIKKYKEKVLDSPSADAINEISDNVSKYDYLGKVKYNYNKKNDKYDNSLRKEYINNINLGLGKNTVINNYPLTIDNPTFGINIDGSTLINGDQPVNVAQNRTPQQQYTPSNTYSNQTSGSNNNPQASSNNKQSATVKNSVQTSGNNKSQDVKKNEEDKGKVWYNGDYWWGVGGFWGVNWNNHNESYYDDMHDYQYCHPDSNNKWGSQTNAPSATPTMLPKADDKKNTQPLKDNVKTDDAIVDKNNEEKPVDSDIQIADKSIEDDILEKAHAVETDSTEDDVIPEASMTPEPQPNQEEQVKDETDTSDCVDEPLPTMEPTSEDNINSNDEIDLNSEQNTSEDADTDEELSSEAVINSESDEELSSEAVINSESDEELSSEAVINSESDEELSSETVINSESDEELNSEAVINSESDEELSSEAENILNGYSECDENDID